MQHINLSPVETNTDVSFQVSDSIINILLKKTNKKTLSVRRPFVLNFQKHQKKQKTLSKIFALETWRRRQHENIIRQLEHVTESLEEKLDTALKENSTLASDNDSFQKQITTLRHALLSSEQRYTCLMKANCELKTQIESLISSIVSTTNENKSLRERESELLKKVEEANLRVAKLLAIKTERSLQTSRYLPVGTSQFHDAQKRQILEQQTLTKTLTQKNLPSKDFRKKKKISVTGGNRMVRTMAPTSLTESYSTTLEGKKKKKTNDLTTQEEDTVKSQYQERLLQDGTTSSRTPLRDRLRSRTKKV